LGAYAHQDLPFEKLVEELQPERSLSHNPLVQVVFSLQNIPREPVISSELTQSRFALDNNLSKFDLSFVMEESEGQINGSLSYSTDLFEAATIRRMLSHFTNLLEHVVEDAEVSVEELGLLSEEERQRLLFEWNETEADYDAGRCVHELVEEQAAREPGRVALVFGGQVLKYSELNEQANRVAHRLRALGVGPESRVAVLMERSSRAVTALLGVLKAGGAYVPIDPQYPSERISFVLGDAQVTVLLSEEQLSRQLNATADITVLNLDTEWDSLSDQSVENLSTQTVSDNLAYVIYTSGSTGLPKGVAVSHQSLVNLLTWHRRAYHVTRSDRATQLAGPAFDASVWELWPYLAAGASVHIPDDETRLSAAGLLRWLARHGVTLSFLPTPLAEAVVEAEAPGGLALRALLTGGDRLQRAPRGGLGYAVVNHYGPTESTVVATAGLVESGPGGPAPPPIGRPIANTQVYLLDRRGQPVPVGVRGELYIGGVGLARGYINRPDLTAEKFVPNPFAREAGARLYRTGDMCRYLPDGNIDYLGRGDEQVKIRGFRIELGEIESVLSQHDVIRECVVIAGEGAAGDKRLVAYVVAKPGAGVEAEGLRQFMAGRLPTYMIPSAFVALEQIPLTPNGKVDRRALPAPDLSDLRPERAFIGPRDLLELRLTQLWEELLGVRPIGVKDNFFELGGHSLLAVRLMSRIHQTFGRELPLSTLFQNATVESFAGVLREEAETAKPSVLVGIRTTGGGPPFFCVHPAAGNVLRFAALASHLEADRPFYALQSQGLYGEARPLRSIEEMAAIYLREMRTVQPRGPYFVGGYSMGGTVAFEIERRLREGGEEVGLLALIDSRAPDAFEPAEDEDGPQLIAAFAADIGLPLESFNLSPERLAQLEPAERLAYVLDEAKAANLVPPDFGLAQAERLYEVFKSNVRAVREYVPRVSPGRATLFKSSEQLARSNVDSTMGWDKFFEGGVSVHTAPGNHYTVMSEPGVQILAAQLTASLNRAEE
jgi:amino acid adenylation domain-containing protein